MSEKLENWTLISKKTILDHSSFLTVEDHTVELPDGTRIEHWPIVNTPEYVNMLVRDTDGRFLCFRQTKYAVGEVILSIPGGYVEPGEDPLVAAKRELLEETGYESPTWIDLGHFVVDSNRGCGKAHLYLALDGSKVTARDADDLEEQQLLFLSREELEKALDEQACPVLAWTTLIALSLRHLASIENGIS